MILRRIALVFGLICAALATQAPEFMEQYRQRLGGAVDELSRVLARFDAEAAQQDLSEQGGVARLRGNADPLARQRAAAIADDRARLDNLKAAQADLRGEGPVARVATLLLHYDGALARGTMADYQPAVPTTAEGFVFGLAGFLVGGGVVHASGRPLRRRLRERAA